MRTNFAVLVPLTLAAALAACSPSGDLGAVQKDVAGLRADLQRLQKENDQLKAQVAGAERRISGLQEDVASVRKLAVDVAVAPAPGEAAAAAHGGTGGDAASPDGVTATTRPAPSAPELKAYLESEEGRHSVEAALRAVQDERDRERSNRMVQGLVDRFARQAGLTEDQTKRMKEIAGKTAEEVRVAWAVMRDTAADASPEERDALRQQNVAKVEEIRRAADDQVKVVLSSTQYEMYQKQQDQWRTGMRGPGGAGRGGDAGDGGQGGQGGGGGRRRGN
jgi:hypothetical protein